MAKFLSDDLMYERQERDRKRVQLRRLEREVLKAAKQWHSNDKGFTRIALRSAIDTLIKFESEHGADVD